MEQGPKEKIVSKFNILWHRNIKDDFDIITPDTVENMVRAIHQRLAIAPLLVGDALKGTDQKLWKIKFSKYRIIYTVRTKSNEVWILSVQKRSVVYESKHISKLLKLAIAIHEQQTSL
jgi:mRNA-degrading endonuclease RelE of RelBE toxin-antitoxin system